MIKNKKVGVKMEKTKKPTKAQIKASLIKQLEAKGANVAHFMDLFMTICRYMI